MTDRTDMIRAGYTVTASLTGAEYPNFAPALGPGWEFVLTAPDGTKRGFCTHAMAWAFADRLCRQITHAAA